MTISFGFDPAHAHNPFRTGDKVVAKPDYFYRLTVEQQRAPDLEVTAWAKVRAPGRWAPGFTINLNGDNHVSHHANNFELASPQPNHSFKIGDKVVFRDPTIDSRVLTVKDILSGECVSLESARREEDEDKYWAGRGIHITRLEHLYPGFKAGDRVVLRAKNHPGMGLDSAFRVGVKGLSGHVLTVESSYMRGLLESNNDGWITLKETGKEEIRYSCSRFSLATEQQIAESDPPTEINSEGTKTWKNADGEIHRIGKPACINSGGVQYWFQRGQLHREDGPAIVVPANPDRKYGDQYWYLFGKELTEEEFKTTMDSTGVSPRSAPNNESEKCKHGHKHYCITCKAEDVPKCKHGHPFYCGFCGKSGSPAFSQQPDATTAGDDVLTEFAPGPDASRRTKQRYRAHRDGKCNASKCRWCLRYIHKAGYCDPDSCALCKMEKQKLENNKINKFHKTQIYNLFETAMKEKQLIFENFPRTFFQMHDVEYDKAFLDHAWAPANTDQAKGRLKRWRWITNTFKPEARETIRQLMQGHTDRDIQVGPPEVRGNLTDFTDIVGLYDTAPLDKQSESGIMPEPVLTCTNPCLEVPVSIEDPISSGYRTIYCISCHKELSHFWNKEQAEWECNECGLLALHMDQQPDWFDKEVVYGDKLKPEKPEKPEKPLFTIHYCIGPLCKKKVKHHWIPSRKMWRCEGCELLSTDDEMIRLKYKLKKESSAEKGSCICFSSDNCTCGGLRPSPYPTNPHSAYRPDTDEMERQGKTVRWAWQCNCEVSRVESAIDRYCQGKPGRLISIGPPLQIQKDASWAKDMRGLYDVFIEDAPPAASEIAIAVKAPVPAANEIKEKIVEEVEEEILLSADEVLEIEVAGNYQRAAKRVARTRAEVEVYEVALIPGMMVWHRYQNYSAILLEETEEGVWSIQTKAGHEEHNVKSAILTPISPNIFIRFLLGIKAMLASIFYREVEENTERGVVVHEEFDTRPVAAGMLATVVAAAAAIAARIL